MKNKKMEDIRRKNYDNLMSLIPIGKENAVSMKYIASMMDIQPRDVRAIVLSAQKEGCFICGDNHGYYRPVNDGEILDYITSRKQSALSTLESIAAMKSYLKSKEVDFDD